MTKGTVKWYDENKGFGFLISEEGEEIFVHRNGLDSPFIGLQPDEEVTFKTRQGDRGLIAYNVKPSI